MRRRTILTGLASLAATPVLAQTAAPAAPTPAPAAPPKPATPAAAAPAGAAPAPAAPPAKPVLPKPVDGPAEAPVMPGWTRINMTTPHGVITIDLAVEKAPISAKNFLRYVDNKRYDGGTFYRASRTKGFEDSMGMLQGGCETPYPPIAHEPTTKTGLSHTDGAISLGRYKPGSAAEDFFICIGDQSGLDADPSQPGDNLGFACFGYVTGGMAVVKKILQMPRSPTKGVGHMKGEMLEPKVPINRVRRA